MMDLFSALKCTAGESSTDLLFLCVLRGYTCKTLKSDGHCPSSMVVLKSDGLHQSLMACCQKRSQSLMVTVQ